MTAHLATPAEPATHHAGGDTTMTTTPTPQRPASVPRPWRCRRCGSPIAGDCPVPVVCGRCQAQVVPVPDPSTGPCARCGEAHERYSEAGRPVCEQCAGAIASGAPPWPTAPGGTL